MYVKARQSDRHIQFFDFIVHLLTPDMNKLLSTKKPLFTSYTTLTPCDNSSKRDFPHLWNVNIQVYA